MDIVKKDLLYSGKAKSLFNTNQADLLINEFRDDTTAFDGAKHEQLANKGVVNNFISAFIMEYLAEHQIPTHFECLLSKDQAVVRRLTMIPLESVVRNIAAGSLCRRLGIEQGKKLDEPLHEFFLKNDELHDPIVTAEHALAFGWATNNQLQEMRSLSMKINTLLVQLFSEHDLILVDAKYEFGVDGEGRLYLADEISPDSCRIWDAVTHESLDKDRFRKDLGNVIASYQKIAQRLGIEIPV